MGFNSSGEQAIIGKDGAVVADASWAGGSRCELSIDNPADEKLIVAAPEILEALKDALCTLDCCGKDYPAASKARAAIAKATVAV
jgi:hypothetical protein